ncbi:competence protein ComGC [Breznakia sp. PF5-3]|uniref:competence type IV pilus major pilin ComGC n=1 Tax=unclassified Breznakia TaxID=2623764 RepID=UPI002405ACE6|nr:MULTISPECIES: competence type IV pilus major pilin ComGC [unclassified Breznakia]MDF9824379.1 competence protein ComGC [Breznakia sp. PM6-1]MDF9835108.1 competence protein ComGC [Breznakia sp. PF5-3]MDF9838912.1 competence protein ComGC [Breznakia sp. PFB2-8]MDF9860940.1 competence protein ComGC [Breznakia sp. PH5-24]
MKKGFTILEMIIVLTIIALIFLLTLPNIQQKKKVIDNKGCEALIEVVNAQILLYEIDTLETPTSVDQLISGGYLKDTQKRCPDGESITISGGEAHASK